MKDPVRHPIRLSTPHTHRTGTFCDLCNLKRTQKMERRSRNEEAQSTGERKEFCEQLLGRL